MNVAWPQRRGQRLRIRHGGEIAVVRGPDPARARGIGAEIAGATASRPADRRRRTGSVEKLSPLGEKHSRSNCGIVRGAGADAVIDEGRLMAVDEAHALGHRILADALAVAGRQRPQPGQEFRRHEADRLAPAGRDPLANAGCTSKPSRPPGHGHRGRLHHRVAIGDIDHPRKIAADHRLERSAQAGEIARQVDIEVLLGVLRAREPAAAAQQQAFRGRFHDHVGDERRKFHVVRSDGEQQQIELAIRLLPARRGEYGAQRAELARDRTVAAGHRRGRAFVSLLAVEQAGVDGGAGAGERNERHREVRVLDSERERGAHLIAVERAMAGRAHPARRVARPVCRRGRTRRCVLAGAVAAVAGPPWTEILTGGRRRGSA